MLRCGADFAGLTEPMNRINKGWLGFDRCITTPSLMPQILKIARILGPKKLMPNPKSGTIVENLKEGISEIKGGGKVEYRADDEGRLQLVIGLTSFTEGAILDNIKYIVREILRFKGKEEQISMLPAINKAVKPAKSDFILKASIQTEQGPLINIDIDRLHPTSPGYFR